jgi:biofilm PGA synthesis lipoprotein PgaB
VQGILLQDDLYLGEDEDVSAYAKEAYRNTFNKEMPNPKKMSKKEKKEFVKWKVEALDNAADEALSAFKEVRPLAITMRDIYSGVALEEGADEWLGQNYKDCLSKYDYTVIMAYPYMDKAKDPSAYLKKIAKTVKDKDKVIVKIQSYDWEKEKYLNQKTFENQLKTLKKAGVKNMGYYPITYAYWK